MSDNIDKGMKAILARMLTTLERKVDPAHTALLVMDVQNDFCAEGGAFDKDGRDVNLLQAMVPNLINFIKRARQAGLPIIFSRSIHSSESSHYLSDSYVEQGTRRSKQRYIEYPVCKKDSWGAEFFKGIDSLPGDVVITKHRFSAFMDTDLELVLRSKGIRTVIVTGMATNVCVETTAREGFCRDYYMVVLRDCTSTYSEELHNNALDTIDQVFGEVADSGDVIKCWQKARS